MKNILSAIIYLSLVIVVSCKDNKDEEVIPPADQTIISYPDSVYYGKNMLSYTDSTELIDGVQYELGAILGKDASLKIVITNYPAYDIASGNYTKWTNWSNTGWTIGNFNVSDSSQTYTSNQSGNVSSQVWFTAYNQTGRCKIDFYENSTAITRTKHFSWE